MKRPCLPRATRRGAHGRARGSLAAVWPKRLDRAEDGASARGRCSDLTHGTLRRYGRVQAIVAALSRRGQPDALVQALLWCSLYALESGRYADYTVVDQAVRACTLLERWTAKGYVNAVLRLPTCASARRWKRASAQTKRHATSIRDGGSTFCSAEYPEYWEEILAAKGNLHPPMTLRVNSAAHRARGVRAAPRGRRHAHTRPGGSGAPARAAGPGRAPARLPEGRRSRCRMPAHSAPRNCSSLPRAARAGRLRRPGRKSAHILERADVALRRSTWMPRVASASSATWSACRCARRARGRLHAAAIVVGRRRVRAHSRRRALHGFRRGAAPSRSEVAAPRGDPAAFAARSAILLERFGSSSPRVVNCCMSPARCSRRRTRKSCRRSSRARARARCRCRTASARNGCRTRQHDGFTTR